VRKEIPICPSYEGFSSALSLKALERTENVDSGVSKNKRGETSIRGMLIRGRVEKLGNVGLDII